MFQSRIIPTTYHVYMYVAPTSPNQLFYLPPFFVLLLLYMYVCGGVSAKLRFLTTLSLSIFIIILFYYPRGGFLFLHQSLVSA